MSRVPARPRHPTPPAGGDRRPSVRVAPLLALLLAGVGCRMPPARFEVLEPDASSRAAILSRQMLADSAVEWAHRPVRSTWTLLGEMAGFCRAACSDVAGTRVVLALAEKPEPPSPDRELVDRRELDAEMEELLGHKARPACIRLHLDGHDALDALAEVIDGARHRIDVLMFMWDSDPLGQEVAARLAARAGPGLKVRVLVDGGGNLIFGEPHHGSAREVNRVVCWLAQQPHVEVLRTRNPFGRFDHRKLILADGRAAWTGGRNLTEKAFFRDHDLSFTVTGPLTADLQACFDAFWEQQGGPPAEPLPPPPAEELHASVLHSLGESNAHARLLGTAPLDPRLARALYHALDRAGHHVYVQNPYVSDGRLLRKIVLARARGADVRVVLTLRGDNALMNAANRVVANRLLAAGVRVYAYPGMTHVKAVSVDRCWAYLGTANLDPLSLRRNHELGVAVAGGPVVGELEDRLFHADFRPEWELTAPVPLQKGDYWAELAASLFL